MSHVLDFFPEKLDRPVNFDYRTISMQYQGAKTSRTEQGHTRVPSISSHFDQFLGKIVFWGPNKFWVKEIRVKNLKLKKFVIQKNVGPKRSKRNFVCKIFVSKKISNLTFPS